VQVFGRNDGLSTHSDGRRPKSAKAGNRRLGTAVVPQLWGFRQRNFHRSSPRRACLDCGRQISADASKTAAEHVPKTERAYLFLELDIKSNLEDLFDLHPEKTISRKAEIVFGFRNHGRTPAIVRSLHVGARYWVKPISDNWEDATPSMISARPLDIQPGLVISSEPVGGYKAELDLTREQFNNGLYGRHGCVLFWGKIVYLDVFKKDMKQVDAELTCGVLASSGASEAMSP
jgi:hypothetical protein